MKRILVPCDFSKPALEAFKFAVQIAQKSKGEIFLLNVVEVPLMYDTVLMPTLNFEQDEMNESKADTERKLEKIKDRWAAEDQKVSIHAKLGPVMPTIQQFVHDEKIDLLVMGTKGASGIREVLVGSNTEKMVRNATAPVIAVKQACDMSSIKNIVLPVHLSLDDEVFMQKVKELQSFFKAKLHVLHINTPSSFQRDSVTTKKLKDFAKRFLLKDYALNILSDLDQEIGIKSFVKENKADMIAMGTHGRKGISHFANGSIAENITNHFECPIWTCKVRD